MTAHLLERMAPGEQHSQLFFGFFNKDRENFLICISGNNLQSGNNSCVTANLRYRYVCYSFISSRQRNVRF